jgi:protein SCO1
MRDVIPTVVRVLVVALVLLVGAMVWTNRLQHRLPDTATLLPNPKALPEVTLTDDQGEPFATATGLKGHFTLLFFGFTNCPDVCPLTLQTLANVAGTLADDAPRVLFVSVDPDRDNPERIRDYLASFDSKFEGATAPSPVLAPLLQSLGVAVHIEKGADDRGYTVTHSATIYVVDPDAKLAAVFGPPHDPTAIANDLVRIRRLYQRRPRASSTSS